MSTLDRTEADYWDTFEKHENLDSQLYQARYATLAAEAVLNTGELDARAWVADVLTDLAGMVRRYSPDAERVARELVRLAGELEPTDDEVQGAAQ